MPALLVPFFSALAKLLLSGLIAQVAVKIILYAAILGAIFTFYKNFSSASLDFALSFFSFFGFDDVINQIRSYYSQLPSSIVDTFGYFEIGTIIAFLINNYISNIFLSWIMRRFG